MKTDYRTSTWIRPYAGEEDVPVMVDMLNAELEADGVPAIETRGRISRWFGTRTKLRSRARHDDRRGRRQAGRLRRSHWVDTNDGLREYRINGACCRVAPPGHRQRALSAQRATSSVSWLHSRDGPTRRSWARGRTTDRRPHRAAARQRLRAGALVLRDDPRPVRAHPRRRASGGTRDSTGDDGQRPYRSGRRMSRRSRITGAASTTPTSASSAGSRARASIRRCGSLPGTATRLPAA